VGRVGDQGKNPLGGEGVLRKRRKGGGSRAALRDLKGDPHAHQERGRRIIREKKEAGCREAGDTLSDGDVRSISVLKRKGGKPPFAEVEEGDVIHGGSRSRVKAGRLFAERKGSRVKSRNRLQGARGNRSWGGGGLLFLIVLPHLPALAEKLQGGLSCEEVERPTGKGLSG